MRANRYLHIAVIGATLLFLVLWQTAAAGPPEKSGNPGLPGCLAKVSELEARIEELEDMLQNFAPVQVTGQTQSYAPGDDGDLQKGVQWPDPRFTDNGDGTVTDNLTRLIWLKTADCFGVTVWWGEALHASNNLADGQCGLSDGSLTGHWRLPNVRELFSLIDFGENGPLPAGHPFTGVGSTTRDGFWSSTTAPYHSPGGGAWCVDFYPGEHYIDRLLRPEDKYDDEQTGIGKAVWPVRGGN